MWVTTHELLQFCRDKSWDPNGAHENNEDNFVDIPGITDILSKWQDMKITKSGSNMISSANKLSSVLTSYQHCYKVKKKKAI